MAKYCIKNKIVLTHESQIKLEVDDQSSKIYKSTIRIKKLKREIKFFLMNGLRVFKRQPRIINTAHTSSSCARSCP